MACFINTLCPAMSKMWSAFYAEKIAGAINISVLFFQTKFFNLYIFGDIERTKNGRPHFGNASKK